MAFAQVDLYWDHTFDAFKECPDTKKVLISPSGYSELIDF